MGFYEVVPVTNTVRSADVLTYSSAQKLAPGTIVTVPLRNSQKLAVVYRGVTKPEFETKDITTGLDVPALPPRLMQLAEWMSEYYAAPLPAVMRSFIPADLNVASRKPYEPEEPAKRMRQDVPLTQDQTKALKNLTDAKQPTAILHGVTGSGKTRIYIELAKGTIKAGRSAIILVPEIALTPQMVADFATSFETVYVTHSALTPAQRRVVWRTIAQEDKPAVVIGPRSALFLPLQDVGLLVVDEFHEPAYFQDQTPKYSAVRVAGRLRELHDARLLLGSATPPVTEMYVAQAKGIPVIHINEPINKAIQSHVSVIDIKERSEFTRSRWFSNTLIDSIETSLNDRLQSLIFHNRRGTATQVMCHVCGWTAMCPNCHVQLTFHEDIHELRCHICSYREVPPHLCPECGSSEIIYRGVGTKAIEKEAHRLFPGATIARFDADVAKPESLLKTYQDVYDGKVNILVGTQMLTKGLDLPKLQTVGIAVAETGLHLPDFTSGERTYQLIHQVIGRAGRALPEARLVIQTYQPDNPLIGWAVNQDWATFYQHELSERESYKYPPFTYLMTIESSYVSRRVAIKSLSDLLSSLKQKFIQAHFLGPSPTFYERRGGRFHWHIVVKASDRTLLTKIAESVPERFIIRLDPPNLLSS